MKNIVFKPEKCPKCEELLTVRKLGVWGYYCEKCSFWWGVIKGYPKVKE